MRSPLTPTAPSLQALLSRGLPFTPTRLPGEDPLPIDGQMPSLSPTTGYAKGTVPSAAPSKGRKKAKGVVGLAAQLAASR